MRVLVNVESNSFLVETPSSNFAIQPIMQLSTGPKQAHFAIVDKTTPEKPIRSLQYRIDSGSLKPAEPTVLVGMRESYVVIIEADGTVNRLSMATADRCASITPSRVRDHFPELFLEQPAAAVAPVIPHAAVEVAGDKAVPEVAPAAGEREAAPAAATAVAEPAKPAAPVMRSPAPTGNAHSTRATPVRGTPFRS